MLYTTTLLFIVVVLILCLYLFDAQPSVILKRTLGIILLILFAFWLFYNLPLHLVR